MDYKFPTRPAEDYIGKTVKLLDYPDKLYYPDENIDDWDDELIDLFGREFVVNSVSEGNSICGKRLDLDENSRFFMFECDVEYIVGETIGSDADFEDVRLDDFMEMLFI